jgi:hypothetical protein
MSVRPPTREAASTAPNRVRGVQTVDRYLLALDGVIEMDGSAFEALELEFIQEAKIFALRVGISYGAWLDVGVSTQVLMRAGLAAELDICADVSSW